MILPASGGGAISLLCLLIQSLTAENTCRYPCKMQRGGRRTEEAVSTFQLSQVDGVKFLITIVGFNVLRGKMSTINKNSMCCCSSCTQEAGARAGSTSVQLAEGVHNPNPNPKNGGGHLTSLAVLRQRWAQLNSSGSSTTGTVSFPKRDSESSLCNTLPPLHQSTLLILDHLSQSTTAQRFPLFSVTV